MDRGGGHGDHYVRNHHGGVYSLIVNLTKFKQKNVPSRKNLRSDDENQLKYVLNLILYVTRKKKRTGVGALPLKALASSRLARHIFIKNRHPRAAAIITTLAKLFKIFTIDMFNL